MDLYYASILDWEISRTEETAGCSPRSCKESDTTATKQQQNLHPGISFPGPGLLQAQIQDTMSISSKGEQSPWQPQVGVWGRSKTLALSPQTAPRPSVW